MSTAPLPEPEAVPPALFETLVDALPAGVVVYDRDGRLLYTNAASTRVGGRTASPVLGRTLREEAFRDPEFLDRHEAALAEAIATGRPTAIHLNPGGADAYRSFEITFVPLPPGRREAVFSFVREVSDLMRAEERLRASEHERALQQAALEQARELERLKSEFVGMVSHELRTPLTSILGYTELMGDETAGPLGEERRSYLEQIRVASDRLLALVDELLDFSRIKSDHFEVRPRPMDLARTLAELTDSVRPQADRAGVTLQLAIAPGAGPLVADAQRVGQVVLNLLGNALKFTPPGGRVSLSLARAGERLRLEVTDTGCGIPEAEQASIFEKFSQVRAPGFRPANGIGLGLAIARAIVEAHGGTIGLTSRVGEGTTFVVELPVVPASRDAE